MTPSLLLPLIVEKKAVSNYIMMGGTDIEAATMAVEVEVGIKMEAMDMEVADVEWMTVAMATVAAIGCAVAQR